MSKKIIEFIEEANSKAKEWIQEGNFKDEADIQLAEDLKMVIYNWENRKSVKSFK